MRQLGPDSFEIKNKKTGVTKVVSGEELSKYGLVKPTKKEKNNNWIPATGGIIGGIAGSIGGPVGAGLGAAAGTAAGGMIKSLITPKQSTEFVDPTKTGFGAKLSQEGRTTAGKDIANISKDAAIAGVSTYAAGKAGEVIGKIAKPYIANIKAGEGILGKAKQLIPSTNISTTGSKLATKGATETSNLFAKNQLLDDVISAAKESSDTSVTNSIKNILTNGTSKETQKLIKNASLDQLKEIALNNSEVTKNIPTNMLEALLKRRSVGAMKSWPTFIQKIIGQSAEPGKGKAAEIFYKALNTQLKIIPDVKKGDAIVQIAKVLGVPVETLLVTGLGGGTVVNLGKKVLGQ